MTAIEQNGHGWGVRTAAEVYPADAIVVATPIPETVRLLRPLTATELLTQVPLASSLTVSLALRDSSSPPIPSSAASSSSIDRFLRSSLAPSAVAGFEGARPKA